MAPNPNSESRHIHNLALVGFMGVGKSTTGRFLADLLGYEYVDTDHVLEELTGTSITEIFTSRGETFFRDLESKLAVDLEMREKLVISTGGGFVLRQENLLSLRKHSLVVCLWASAEAIYERVKHQTHRPLLQQADPKARIQELLTARDAQYRKADVLVQTEGRTTREIAHQILHQFQTAERASPRT